MSEYETKVSINKIEREVESINKKLDDIKKTLKKIIDSVYSIEMNIENNQ